MLQSPTQTTVAGAALWCDMSLPPPPDLTAEQAALSLGAAAARARLCGSRRRRRRIRALGHRANAAVGELDADPHPGRDGGRGAERGSFGVAHERKAARQDAAIREGGEQLAGALDMRFALADQRHGGAGRTLREPEKLLALARDLVAVRGDIRPQRRRQALRQAVEAIIATLARGADRNPNTLAHGAQALVGVG